ncbi:MAG: 30S ribosomal protein S9 [Candidatus Zixiibacteriota bacterium]
MATIVFQGTGRRKTAVAQVRLSQGTGRKLINGKNLPQYLGRENLVIETEKPLEVTNTNGKMDVICKAKGGGISAQAGAIKLGIARALIKFDESFKKVLKKEGLLTRDPRMVERKKYGQVKARKRYQYSKR